MSLEYSREIFCAITVIVVGRESVTRAKERRTVELIVPVFRLNIDMLEEKMQAEGDKDQEA